MASAERRSESPGGGDSFLRFKYAVRSRSVERSSMRERLEVFGADVCDGDEVAARGSVTILCVHYQQVFISDIQGVTPLWTHKLHTEPGPERDARRY